LIRHQRDRLPGRYGLERLLAAQSEDRIWNAAQRQLLEEGRIHNYLRVVWGKRILEWGDSAEEALHWAIELNNRLALDGRDPNSYSGIFWCFGRFDRPWAPEPPIFGTVRYLSSRRTEEKFDLEPYLKRFSPLANE
jgi:deoxyribodipyrimidine photo-lyase